MHPALRNVLLGVGRVGYRAAAAAVASGLKDIDREASRVAGNIKRARQRAEAILDGTESAPERENHRG